MDIKSLLSSNKQINKTCTVKGWVKTKRGSKKIAFITLNDGSTIQNLKIVVNVPDFSEDLLKKINTGTSLSITGTITASQGQGQAVEMQAAEIQVLGIASPEEYPLQPKKHSLDFLRSKAHLRFRTNTFSAVFRIRHTISYAIHNFFHQRKF